MPLEPDRRYDGVVVEAGLTQSEEKGTPAVWFKIKTEDGTIDHSIWIAPATVARAKETMQKCFGTTPAQLADMAWLDGLSGHLAGSEVSIVTESEERRDGSFETKVKWLNPRGFNKKPPTPATKSKVAQLFGAPSPGPMPGRGASEPPPPAWDDDVPY